jgi:hypothetical protein
MFRALPKLICLSLFIFASGRTNSPTPAPAVPDPPKPLLIVSFGRQSIKEDDAIDVRLILNNEWDQALSDAVLQIDSPPTLIWNATTCEQWRQHTGNPGLVDRTLKIGAIGPKEVRRINLCVKSGHNVDVGEFNILFAIDYSWNQNNVARHSLVTTEKALKANLFGSDAVAGVPIALAAFIVPGLFFWLVLQLLKSPWTIGGLGLGDKLLYSVLTSFVLLWVVNLVRPDPDPSISFSKLVFYAATGLVSGLIAGMLILTWQAYRERQRKKRQIKLADSPEVLLGKLLKLYPDYHNATGILRTAAGETYSGSLAAKTEEVVAIVGWFQIDRANISGPKKAEVLQALDNAKSRAVDIYDVATKYNLAIEARDPINLEGNPVKALSFTNPSKDATAQTSEGVGSGEALVVV